MFEKFNSPTFLYSIVFVSLCFCDTSYGAFYNLEKTSTIFCGLVGTPCATTAECLIPNTTCIPDSPPDQESNKHCKCDPAIAFEYCETEPSVQNRCIMHPNLIGEACTTSAHCKKIQDNTDNSLLPVVCKLDPILAPPIGNCQCGIGSVSSNSLEKCLKLISNRRENCQESQQCSPLGYASCFPDIIDPEQRVCECIGLPTDSYYNTSIPKCFDYKNALMEECSEDQQCFTRLGAAECRSHPIGISLYCQCKETNVKELDGYCWQLLGNDRDVCGNSVQCELLNNTDCLPGPDPITGDDINLCRCTSGLVDIDLSGAVNCKNIIYEETGRCENHLQCQAGMGVNSDCMNNRCQCNYNTRYVSTNKTEKCYTPTYHGQTCDNNEECFAGVGPYSQCNLNSTRKCSCTPSSIEWQGHCYQPKVIGSSCETDEECTVPIKGEVRCDPIDKKCACKIDFVSDGVGICRSGGIAVLTTTSSAFFILLISLPILKHLV